jgi:hypothetical protein
MLDEESNPAPYLAFLTSFEVRISWRLKIILTRDQTRGPWCSYKPGRRNKRKTIAPNALRFCSLRRWRFSFQRVFRINGLKKTLKIKLFFLVTSILIGRFASREKPLGKNDLFSPFYSQAGYEVSGLAFLPVPLKHRSLRFLFRIFSEKREKTFFSQMFPLVSNPWYEPITRHTWSKHSFGLPR